MGAFISILLAIWKLQHYITILLSIWQEISHRIGTQKGPTTEVIGPLQRRDIERNSCGANALYVAVLLSKNISPERVGLRIV